MMDNSACLYMFSDIQGTAHKLFIIHYTTNIYSVLGSIDKATNDADHFTLTLFDPMTHTPKG